jgi:hypothetical protein
MHSFLPHFDIFQCPVFADMHIQQPSLEFPCTSRLVSPQPVGAHEHSTLKRQSTGLMHDSRLCCGIKGFFRWFPVSHTVVLASSWSYDDSTSCFVSSSYVGVHTPLVSGPACLSYSNRVRAIPLGLSNHFNVTPSYRSSRDKRPLEATRILLTSQGEFTNARHEDVESEQGCAAHIVSPGTALESQS